MPAPQFEYSFVAHPALNDAFKDALNTPEKKEAFLIRLATTLGDSPRTAGTLLGSESLYKGKRKLDHMDDALGFCVVVFKVEWRKITIYAVVPMKA